ALSGAAPRAGWEGAEREFDFLDLKGRVESLLEDARVPAPEWTKVEKREFALALEMRIGGTVIGWVGEIAEKISRSKKIEGRLFYAEIDLDAIRSARFSGGKFRALPHFPAIQRDLALVAPEERSYAEVAQVLRKTAEKCAAARKIFLEDLRLFDIYRSEQWGGGKKSLAFRFTYRSLEKTLTDAEVNAIHDQVIAAVCAELGVQVRA
ncbi:MAG: hypothetical protein JO317_01095, partial [Verrucomicrobiae bacterium]|nr:hypothetical protein [Verrucomicrobiae bacterium]